MAASILEPAIPPHLRVERTRPSNLPEGYQPHFPAYSARFPEKTKSFVMAIFGIQSRGSPLRAEALKPVTGHIMSSTALAPSFWEAASLVDTHGEENQTVIAYWPDKETFVRWAEDSGFDAWWDSLDPEVEEVAWFKEVFFPPIERFETVFSDNGVAEGAAHMRSGVSGQLQEHVYWGSMRDRLPASQTDALEGEKYRSRNNKNIGATDNATTRRIRVPGKPNLCIIRSGQDWSNTKPEERTLYLDTMHPVLVKGMDFLRDKGQGIGCYSCRFMSVLDSPAGGTDTDRTFGLAYFDEMASLEKWSREHQTHLNIFHGFLEYAAKLQGNVSLRLFHEVLVLQPQHQDLEYIGCHAGTGLLTSLST